MSNFNKSAFLEDAKKIHLQPGEIPRFESIQDTDVRRRIDEFIDYGGNPRLSVALGEVCTNVVGRTMFKLLMSKLPPGRKVKVVDIGPEEACTGDPLVDQKGSSYSHAMHVVRINLNVYDSSGIGIRTRQYYCVDERGNITFKRKSLSGSIFHEFTHCLHHIEDSARYERDRIPQDPEDKLWTSKEECRTIAGYVTPDTYDPICDNCFHLCESVTETTRYPPTSIKSTTYHITVGRKPLHRLTTSKATPHRPRLGHIGYVKGRSEFSATELRQLHTAFNFNLAWPSKYIV